MTSSVIIIVVYLIFEYFQNFSIRYVLKELTCVLDSIFDNSGNKNTFVFNKSTINTNKCLNRLGNICYYFN